MTPTKIDLGPEGLTWHRKAGTTPRQFQVLGERGSGTNVVRKYLEKNLRFARTDKLGWKHAFPHMVAIPDDVLVVCVVRNAWDWAKSMHKRPWHVHPSQQALGFSGFVRAEWQTIVDRPTDFDTLSPDLNGKGAALQHDRHPITGLPFPNIFALRTAKLQGLLGIANRNCSYLFVTLETVNADPAAFVSQVAAGFDLDRRKPKFQGVHRRMGNLHKRAVKDVPPTSEAALQEDYKFMARSLDTDLEAQFGYTYDAYPGA